MRRSYYASPNSRLRGSRRAHRLELEFLEDRLAPSVNVVTYHNDNSSTGQNLNESLLTPVNVAPNTFGKLASVPVDGQVYAQPLYVAGVDITRGVNAGLHNVVYVATEHDSLYAIDADTGTVLWKDSFINPAGGVTTIPSSVTLTNDIHPEIGITSTPVIDAATNTLYLDAMTQEIVGGQANYVQRLHAIDITSGSEKFGGPAVIADTVYDGTNYTYLSGPTVPGTGAASVNGLDHFNALREGQRSGLTLSNGSVYIGFASHGDNGPYAGWLLGYSAQTLLPTAAINLEPNGSEGGIWGSGDSATVDAKGNIYVATGNGTFDTTMNAGGFPIQGDYGDSVVKLAPDPTSSANNPNINGWGLKVVDYFTPSTQQILNDNDLDLASGGITLLPASVGSKAHPNLLVITAKQGITYLIDQDNMGQFNPNGDNTVQEISGSIGGTWSTPAYFDGNLYYSGINSQMVDFPIANGLIGSPSSVTPTGVGYPSMTPSVSADGTSNAIVWTIQADAYGSNGPAILHAYSASNLGDELYNTTLAGARDQLGGAVKFSVPTVADGQVFVGTDSELDILGTFPGSITGQVYNDANADGKQQANETGIAGVTVYLDLAGTGTLQTGDPSAVTDANGNFSFKFLPYGTYQVRQVPMAGLTQTTISPTVNLAIGQNLTGATIGDFRNVTLTGQVFQDTNGDGILEPSEPGLSSWTVYLDTNKDGMLDDGEVSTTTNSQGDYSFPNLAPGTYRVRVVPQAGFQLTSPLPADAVVNNENSPSGFNFGEFEQAGIVGQVFQDQTGDGVQGPADPPLPGWTVQLLSASSGMVLQTATTDLGGTYAFSGLAVGTYQLQVVLPSGWIQTTPALPNVVINRSGTSVTNQNIGAFQLTSISGQVFVDNNGDGALDGSDVGLANWTVQLLNPQNQVLTTTQSDSTGSFVFDNVGPGSYFVREVLPSGWIHTTAAPGAIRPLSGSQNVVPGFGNFQPASLGGKAFEDIDGTGTDTATDPELSGLTIQLVNSATGQILQTQTTDSQGDYLFGDLDPGTYNINEILPAGSVLTTVAPANLMTTSGTDLLNLNLGNFQLISVTGSVFNDLGMTGTDSAGDPGLGGVTVKLFRDTLGTGVLDTTVDPPVQAVTTSISLPGQFVFTGVGAGNYIVAQLQQSGIVQTAPSSPLTFAFSARSGTSLTGFQFGDVVGGNSTYVARLYVDLLGRNVDLPGLAFWTNSLNNGVSRSEVIQGIMASAEYRTQEVDHLYSSLLNRSPDPAGLAYSLGFLAAPPANTDPVRELEVQILGSAEYFQTQGGATNQGFLTALYQDVFGRAVDSAASVLYGGMLARGSTTSQIARIILFSAEADQDIVETYYEQYLHRAADPTGLQLFAGYLENGGQLNDIIQGITGSNEYYFYS